MSHRPGHRRSQGRTEGTLHSRAGGWGAQGELCLGIWAAQTTVLLPPPHGLPGAPLSWPGCRRTFYGNHFRALAGVAYTSGLAGGRGALGGQPRWSASFSAPESFLSPGQDRDFEVADILMLNLLRFRVFSYSLELMSFLLWGLASLRGEV